MPLNTTGFRKEDLAPDTVERFERKVDRSGGPEACHLWTAGRGSHGYGMASIGQMRQTTAHRVAYVLAVGPIEPGMVIDHNREVCSSRLCCNPAHLRQLTNAENSSLNQHFDKTHCPRGHEYDEENTYQDPSGSRRCRECARITKRAWLKLQREKEAAA